MKLQGYLQQLEANEQALKQHADTISEDDYQKLVAHHLQLIAQMKEAGAPRPNPATTNGSK